MATTGQGQGQRKPATIRPVPKTKGVAADDNRLVRAAALHKHIRRLRAELTNLNGEYNSIMESLAEDLGPQILELQLTEQ